MATYYVCINTGNDNNHGSEENPFKTIQCATDKCNAGDTILVKPGIYRERIIPKVSGKRDAKITYKSLVKHGAIIRGSTLWHGEKYDNGILSGKVDDSLFTDHSHKNGANPFLIKTSVTPFGREGEPESKIKSIKYSDKNMIYCLGQVFADNVMFKQCPYKNEMEITENSWFFDHINKMLYINGSNLGNIIEITNQRRLFAPNKRGLKNIVVSGFIFERCGNQYPNKFWSKPDNQQSGAVGTRSGKYWIIEDNIIQFANGIGIDWGNEGSFRQDLELGNNGNAFGSYGHVIKNNIIRDNGAAGTAAYMANSFEFTNNIVERNNNLHFSGKQRWESAGVKVHNPKNSKISNNIIRDNYCHGIWSDQGAGKKSIFKNNLILNNEKNGIEFEIGQRTTARVINNIFDGNDNGIRFSASGGALIAHNLFINSRTCDIQTHVYKREKDKWDSHNVEIYYNLFFHSPQFLKLSPPTDFASRYLDYNVYATNELNKKFHMKFNWKNKINLKFESWIDLISELNDDENCDKNSVKIVCRNEINNASIIKESDKYFVSIQLLNPLPEFTAIDKVKNETDYNGQERDSLLIAGPFKTIKNGVYVEV